MASDQVVKQVGQAIIHEFEQFGKALMGEINEMKDLLERIAKAVEDSSP